MSSTVHFSELSSSHLSEAAPYAVVTPPGYDQGGPFPLCLMLMGGGGKREHLAEMQPLLDTWWAEGWLAPMVLATPTAGMSYYLEDPEFGVRWEAFLVRDLIPLLRVTFKVGADRRSTALMGMSMGGYGALKTAFAHPEMFAAVAAMNPMIEPGYVDADIGPRNRIHHSGGGPPRLIGPARDPELFAANNPAVRARTNGDMIRGSGLAIYIETGDQDFVNAHDGAEFLHRVLWDLDISHEYRLLRGADHLGPTVRPRMRDTFAWLSAALADPPASPSPEQVALDTMRAHLRPIHEHAAASDPSARRRYGVMPR
jgi:S-formylglutathione hydrolase